MTDGRSRNPAKSVPGELLDPAHTAQDLSNRVVQPLVAYLREVMGDEALGRCVVEAGLPVSWFEDPQAWVSGAWSRRFIGLVASALGGVDEGAPHDHPVWQHWRKAGVRSIRTDITGPIWSVLRALGSPRGFYRSVPGLVARANRVTRMELVRQGAGVSVLRCSPVPQGPPDLAAYFWNRIGTFEAAPTIWGFPSARVDHVRCLHDPLAPADACEYIVRYQERHALPTLGLVALLVAGAASAAWLWPAEGVPPALAGALCGGLAVLSLAGWRRASRGVRDNLAYGHDLSQAVDDLDGRYNRLWEERRKLRTSLLANRKISGYLDASLVEEIMANPELELRLGGTRVRGAVLFADIVGFTPRCEASTPERVVSDLNTYFAHIDPVIDAHHGIIDKRMGDGVMAVFVDRS